MIHAYVKNTNQCQGYVWTWEPGHDNALASWVRCADTPPCWIELSSTEIRAALFD